MHRPGDLDLTIYSLRKWVRLALAGNPTVLLLLFAPASLCRVRTEQGAELQALAPAFIARTVAASFVGMAVRRGEVGLTEVLAKTEELERRIDDLAATAPLRESPDSERVERWMIRTYLEHEAWR